MRYGCTDLVQGSKMILLRWCLRRRGSAGMIGGWGRLIKVVPIGGIIPERIHTLSEMRGRSVATSATGASIIDDGDV